MMFIGLLFALAACFIWGAIFIVPQFLPDFTSIEVALGRYFAYGILSTCLFIGKGTRFFRRYPLKIWMTAFIFGLVANVVYYMGVVLGLRYATPPLTVLVVGMCPVLAAIYGNWQAREIPYRSLVFPCLWIMMGMILLNIDGIDWSFSSSSLKEYAVGFGGAIVGLLTWTWYAVQNARFLKNHPDLPRTDWATLIGLSTLFWVILLGGTIACCSHRELDLSKFITPSPSLLRFLLCIAVLGIVCSWVGGYFWNQASTYLPLSVMGSFIIFETIFGLAFVFVFEMRTPSLLELFGIASMLGGILLCLYNCKKRSHVT